MLFMAVPGVQELLEDAAHFLADGHTAHDAGHADEQPEHCCSGLFHVCPCHANAVGELASMSAVAPAHALVMPVLVHEAEGLRPGFHSPPFRPPTVLA
jgi:hypothetical protein